jgi:cystathionine beta-lyase
LAAKLTRGEVFDLVVDYLKTNGYTETAEVLKKETSKASQSSKILQNQHSRLEDMLEKSYVTELASGEFYVRKFPRSHLDGELLPDNEENLSLEQLKLESTEERQLKIETQIISYNPCENDPYGASSMPIYQTATFAQPSATMFGEYDYTRSGNPTRDALQNQIALLEGVPGAKAFCFTTGMAALSAVCRLAQYDDEIIVNDDSYGGTYRLMSKVATRHGMKIRYVNMAGAAGPANLQQAISNNTKLVMIESPTNPMQRICNIEALSVICRANNHPTGTLLSIDNTMMSPVLSKPLQLGADIVVHSATKFMSGHSDTMAGAVIVRPMKGEAGKTLAETLYFYQNAEGTALAPFDCWLVSRGIKTMPLRVERQQQNAIRVAEWLQTIPVITKVIYAGLPTHPDFDIHSKQASGGGSVVCFLTGNTCVY